MSEKPLPTRDNTTLPMLLLLAAIGIAYKKWKGIHDDDEPPRR